MNYRLHNRIGKALFEIWKGLAPALSSKYQYFDTQMFLENEMCPEFEWKKYVDKKNPYFKKWGFDVSQLDAEYYSRVSGIKADHYVTRSMAVHYIYPYLDRYDFVPAYMDKNAQKSLLHIPDANLDITMPEEVIYNSNGIFFSGEGQECSREDAVKILMDHGADMILKPSVETFGGRGVIKVPANVGKSHFEALIEEYGYNFTFQKIVEQHPIMAQFNPTSVNTVRIVTYRDFHRDRHVLYACVRFGGEGSVMDNVCSGGGYTGVDVMTGHLINRRRYSYYIMDVPLIPDTMPDEIPCWEMMKTMALILHSRLPHLDIVGWDFTLDSDGHPVLIEFNPRPGVGLQQAVGPMFPIDTLDEIMSHVSKVKSAYMPLGVIRYKDFPDRKTVHLKFGGY